jgi:hypothetical protein
MAKALSLGHNGDQTITSVRRARWHVMASSPREVRPMRLEHLCDVELAYQGGFNVVRPYGGEEGTGFGAGDGTVRGQRLSGTVRWVNHPHRRSDATMLPDAHGLITTADGAEIMFAFSGRSVMVDTPEGPKRRQVLPTLFEAEDERYRWLNSSVCILEGKIDPQTLRMEARIYVCMSEML